jgi:hypothetical protein
MSVKRNVTVSEDGTTTRSVFHEGGRRVDRGAGRFSDHIDHCLEQAVGPMQRAQRQSLAEFDETTTYL